MRSWPWPGRIRPPEQVLPWLYQVVRNAATATARSAIRRRRRESVASVPEAWFTPADDRLDAADAARALAGLATGEPRSDRRPTVGRIDVRRSGPAGRLFIADGPPPLSRGPDRTPNEVERAMQPNADDLSRPGTPTGRLPPAADRPGRRRHAVRRRPGRRPEGSRTIGPGRPSRACFAPRPLVLGTALVGERSERLALADRLSPTVRVPETPAPTAVAPTELPRRGQLLRRSPDDRTRSDDLFRPRRHRGRSRAAPPVPEQPTLRAWSPELTAVNPSHPIPLRRTRR